MTVDVLVVGAGVVGAACAHELARRGLQVLVVDRGQAGAGTSSSGEGNVLVSDKPPGPELDLALVSAARWRDLAEPLACEYEPKGGLVVARTEAEEQALAVLAARHREAGVQAHHLDGTALADLEPHLAPGHRSGVLYPQDAQVQPMLATAGLLALARAAGARVRTGHEVVALQPRTGGLRVTLAPADGGATSTVDAAHVVNAAGPWADRVAALAGCHLPVQPRRGVVLVLGGARDLVRHKVYAADYVADVASDRPGLETSPVVEGTPAGTVLVGASRERVGFDPATPVDVVQALARGAVALFPALARARLLRTYRGYRPYLPDHLPVIGPDPHLPALVHAAGHEGAGIGLAPGTGLLVADLVTGATPVVDPAPFAAGRFAPPVAPDAAPPGAPGASAVPADPATPGDPA